MSVETTIGINLNENCSNVAVVTQDHMTRLQMSWILPILGRIGMAGHFGSKIVDYVFQNFHCFEFPDSQDKRAGISKMCLLFFTLFIFIPWSYLRLRFSFTMYRAMYIMGKYIIEFDYFHF